MRKVKFRLVIVDSKGRRHSIFARDSYDLEYPVGSIVRAREETLGVSVFKTKKQAEKFRGKYFEPHFKMIRVRPIGCGKVVKLICTNQNEIDLNVFYRRNLYRSIVEATQTPPPGTIFYPAVEVLD